MGNNISDASSMLQYGSTLQMGKYRIDRYLSSGGFGNTYLATDTRFNELVAVKEFFMRDINLRDGDSVTVTVSHPSQMKVFQEQRDKFKVEARRLRKLHNPHIVGVSDLFDENGTSYYVMDFIDGQSLRDMVKKRGWVDEDEVLGYFKQTLDALEFVHNQGVFHLDMKPANIMVDKDGHVWVIDFGASKQQKSDGGGATSRSAVCYTPGYAPIEQKEQEFENFGPWTDLYALGATLYNVLTGCTPPSTNRILDKGDNAFIFPEVVSEKMRGLVLWMMKGRRDDRPQSVAEVKAYLKNVINAENKAEDKDVEDHGAEAVAVNDLAKKPDKSEQPDGVPKEEDSVVEVEVIEEGSSKWLGNSPKEKPEEKNDEATKPRPEEKVEEVSRPGAEESSEAVAMSDRFTSSTSSPEQSGENNALSQEPPRVEQHEDEENSEHPGGGKKKWLIVAACILVGFVSSIVLIPRLSNKQSTTDGPTIESTEEAVLEQDTVETVSEQVTEETVLEQEVKEEVITVTDKEYKNKTLGIYTYTGPVDNDSLPNGRGEAKLKSKATYKGSFVHGVFEGEDAEFVFFNGDVFKGLFKDNLFAHGILTKKRDGSYFDGDFQNGNAFNGKWYDKNGKFLEEWKNGKKLLRKK